MFADIGVVRKQFGAVCPARDAAAGLVLPVVNMAALKARSFAAGFNHAIVEALELETSGTQLDGTVTSGGERGKRWS